jgi:hypothetical protein
MWANTSDVDAFGEVARQVLIIEQEFCLTQSGFERRPPSCMLELLTIDAVRFAEYIENRVAAVDVVDRDLLRTALPDRGPRTFFYCPQGRSYLLDDPAATHLSTTAY